jgi:hypothetical protein
MAKRTICVSAQLEEGLAAKLGKAAAKARSSKSWIIREALVKYFQEIDAEQRKEAKHIEMADLIVGADPPSPSGGKKTRQQKKLAKAAWHLAEAMEALQSEEASNPQVKPVLDQEEPARRLDESVEEGKAKPERLRKE